MKKKIGIIIAGVILIAITLFVRYYFVGKKSFDVYVEMDIGKPCAVRLDCLTGEEQDTGLWIYDMDIVDEMYDIIYTVKTKPYWSMYDKEEVDRQFSIDVMGPDNKRVYISADDYGDCYVAYIGGLDNGRGVEDNIWGFAGRVCIDKEEGDKLYELVCKRYEENIRNIAAKDIETFSKEKVTDWRKFRQFRNVKIELELEDILVIDGEEYHDCYRLQIDGKEGHILVWTYEASVHDAKKGETKEYYDVVRALVYNEKGESMDLYDEGIGEFLEAMK